MAVDNDAELGDLHFEEWGEMGDIFSCQLGEKGGGYLCSRRRASNPLSISPTTGMILTGNGLNRRWEQSTNDTIGRVNVAILPCVIYFHECTKR